MFKKYIIIPILFQKMFTSFFTFYLFCKKIDLPAITEKVYKTMFTYKL